MIIIAHRLSTVRTCDEIVMLNKSTVAAEGTYDELLEESQEFQKLARAAS